MVDLGKTTEKERLWLMTCLLCNHTFYLPIGEKVNISERIREYIRNFLHLKTKLRRHCPVCDIGRVVATKKVTRTKLVANRKE